MIARLLIQLAAILIIVFPPTGIAGEEKNLKILHNPFSPMDPEVLNEWQENGWFGSCDIALFVKQNNEIQDFILVESTGNKEFDEAVKEVALGFKISGKSYDCWVKLSVNFPTIKPNDQEDYRNQIKEFCGCVAIDSFREGRFFEGRFETALQEKTPELFRNLFQEQSKIEILGENRTLYQLPVTFSFWTELCTIFKLDESDEAIRVWNMVDAKGKATSFVVTFEGPIPKILKTLPTPECLTVPKASAGLVDH